MPEVPPLVLLDVDGTLLLSDDPLFGQAALAAIADVYGLELPQDALERIDHPGQTTLKILRELSGRAERLDECCSRISSRYLELLAEADTSGWKAAPDAHAALTAVKERADIALLTGNPEPVARARMERLSLDGLFEPGQGAFGCEAEHRVDLIALARGRAGDRAAASTWTVGDTPTDVSSAHAAGVRCVAVASGRFRREELVGADAVIEKLDELPRTLF